MATEIARTEIQVDSKQVVGAKRAVDALGTSAIKSESKTKKLSRRFKEMAKTSLGAKLSIAALGVAIVSFSKGVVQANSTMENYELRMKILLGTQAEANELFKDMVKFAGKVPFEFEAIMASATQLSGILKGGSKEVSATIPLIADLAATSGLGIQTTTEQIVRMFSAGAASADLFRERGITAMLGFQAGVSVSAEETKKRVIEAWEKTGSKFRGATDQMAETWTGKVSMMSDAWFKFKTNVADTGEAKEGVRLITEALNFWSERLRKLTVEEERELRISQLRALSLELASKGHMAAAVQAGLHAAGLQRLSEEELAAVELAKVKRDLQRAYDQEREAEAIKAKQRAKDDAEKLKKQVAAEKQANDTIFNMKLATAGRVAALIRSSAGANKEALIAAIAIEKAIAISRIKVSTEVAAMKALEAGPGGVALSAQIRALGISSIALVAATGVAQAAQVTKGQAHDGMANIPTTGSFILEKGERVVKKTDNKALTKALESGQLGGGTTIVVNVDATGSTNTEEVVRQAAEEGARLGYERVANDMARGGPIRMGIS